MTQLLLSSSLASSSILVMIVLGGLVTATGTGLAGGTDWPIPRQGLLPTPEALLEYLHRAWAMVVLLSVLSTTFLAWRLRASRLLRSLATLTLLLLLIQILLGMVVLQTRLHFAIVALHNALASSIFALAFSTTLIAWMEGTGKTAKD